MREWNTRGQYLRIDPRHYSASGGMKADDVSLYLHPQMDYELVIRILHQRRFVLRSFRIALVEGGSDDSEHSSVGNDTLPTAVPKSSGASSQ